MLLASVVPIPARLASVSSLLAFFGDGLGVNRNRAAIDSGEDESCTSVVKAPGRVLDESFLTAGLAGSRLLMSSPELMVYD